MCVCVCAAVRVLPSLDILLYNFPFNEAQSGGKSVGVKFTYVELIFLMSLGPNES